LKGVEDLGDHKKGVWRGSKEADKKKIRGETNPIGSKK